MKDEPTCPMCRMIGSEVKLVKKKNGLWYCPEHKGDVGLY
jgi:hypothetical protein